MKKNAKDSMADALGALNDPATMAEAAKLMKDPNFLAQVQKMAKDPQFQNYMGAVSKRLTFKKMNIIFLRFNHNFIKFLFCLNAFFLEFL